MANETSWFQFYWTCGSLHLQGRKRQALKPLHDDCAKEDVPPSVLIGFERWRRAAEGEHHGIRHRIKSMLFTRWDSGNKRFHSHFWRHFASSKIRLSSFVSSACQSFSDNFATNLCGTPGNQCKIALQLQSVGVLGLWVGNVQRCPAATARTDIRSAERHSAQPQGNYVATCLGTLQTLQLLPRFCAEILMGCICSMAISGT